MFFKVDGRTVVVMPLVALFIVSGVMLTDAKVEAQESVIRTRMTSPATGSVLVPGQRLSVSWQVDVPKDLNMTWCEQEIFLVNRETGREHRLTRELGGAVRKHTITIPYLITGNAILDIRYGCQQGPYLFEAPNPQAHAVFAIGQGDKTERIVINAIDFSEVKVGDTVTLTWESSVEDVKNYEVLVSYDRGAHFRTIGKTKGNKIKWEAPADAAGSAAIFQVVAKKKDGSKTQSLMTEEALKVVEDQQ